MNFFPFIDKPKKGCKFSNPLTGIIYNNNNYLKQCHYQPDPQVNFNIPNIPRRSSMNMGHSMINESLTKKSKQKRLSRNSNRPCFSYKASDSKINYSATNNSKLSNPEPQVNSQKSIFKFPDIQVKIIDQIKCYKDFVQKNLKINLGHYFGMFFRKNLAGPLTVDLIQIVQKYLQVLSSKGSLDHPVQTKDYPSQYFCLNSKRTFVERIQQLQVKKSFKPIQQMIKYYCVPTRQFRQSCFRDIVYMINQTLYEKFSLSKEKEYYLLDQNGKLISDICQFRFSTSLLLITNNPQYQKAYNQYKSIIKSNLQNFKKITFSQELKKNFRQKIASGKVQQSKGPSESELIQAQQRRKFAQSKLQMHRNSDKSEQKRFSPSKTTNNFGFKSKQKYQRESKSSLAKPASLNQIPTVKIRTLSGKKRDQAYMASFQKLYFLNSTIDVSFNHYNQKKILMKIFKKHFDLFKSKTTQQIDAIIKAFRIDPNSESIQWQQYQKINQVANCKGQNTAIVQFVGRYLPFNQYGELDKQSLHKMIKFILTDAVGQEVVLEIIWSWLQKNNLISNNVLVRNTLESWYEKNKMAFVIVVSLVFGTNQASWIDMAYQILV